MNCFVIFFFILGLAALYGADKVKKGLKPYWFPEGGEIMFSCEVANADNDLSIKWSDNDAKPLSNMSNGEVLITNSRIGTKITSKIKFTNSSTFSAGKLYYVDCALYDKGDATDDTSRYFHFRVLLDKDRPNVTVSIKKTEIEIGGNITLLCNAHGDLGVYILDITWSKDGKLLKTVNQTRRGEVIDLTYNITKANGSTGGIYMCRANGTTYLKEEFQDNETVSLSVIPKLIGSNGTSFYYTIRKTVRVQCEIDGYPLNIIWLKKSYGITTQVISDGSRFKITENGRRLTISSFQADDATDFSCKNKDENGNEIVQIFTLLKKVPPQIAKNSKTKELVFIPGQVTILKCEISADPSCVSWNTFESDNETKRGVDDIPGVVPPSPCNKTLWFKNVSAVKNGQKFSCSVQSVTQTFTVIKMTKPRLTGPSTKEAKVKEGDDVTIKCDIMVNPLIVTWLVDDRLLNASADSKYVIASDDVRLVKVRDVDYDDRGSIYCSAKNALDKKGVRQEIILHVLQVKDPSTAVWPVAIGIAAAVIVVALIIGISIWYKKRRARRGESGRPVELKQVSKTDGDKQLNQQLLDKVDG